MFLLLQNRYKVTFSYWISHQTCRESIILLDKKLIALPSQIIVFILQPSWLFWIEKSTSVRRNPEVHLVCTMLSLFSGWCWKLFVILKYKYLEKKWGKIIEKYILLYIEVFGQSKAPQHVTVDVLYYYFMSIGAGLSHRIFYPAI